jgi:hypothetical protein
MSRYFADVPACTVEQAFADAGHVLSLESGDVTLFFGYDRPLAIYFLDVEDIDGEAYHEFGYGGRPFVPGTRLTKGQLLEVVGRITTEVAGDRLMAFQDAVALDLPV